MKYLSFHPDESGRKVIASFKPEESTEAVTLAAFMQALNTAGFGGYSLHQTSIDSAIKKCNSGEAFEIMVAEALDGTFSISIDAGLMAAYLSCTLPQGGAPVQLQSVLQEAANKGITAELDVDAIEKALREGGESVLIAHGKPPVPGIDGKIESLVPSMKERSPHLDEHGLADFRDLGEIATVHAGDGLMRIIPPTSGEPGETVTGKTIPPKPGKKIIFAKQLEGAAVDPNDPNLLIASISGYPVVSRDGVTVEPTYTVKNVDLHTGNISFDGAVHVSGDVMADMKIKATGDIQVDGTVESAVLEAGGDVVIKGGVIGGSELQAGPDEKFHAVIKCGGSCTARFVQNAYISAGQGIFIHDIAMLSELTAGHQIIVGDKGSRRGDIIGGNARATMLVKAQNIGSPSYVKTVVYAGADQLLHERHNIAIKACEASEHKLADVNKLLDLARQHPGRLPPETIRNAEATRDALITEFETLNADVEELRKEIDLANSAQVVVEKHVFGGAEIHISLKRYKTEEIREGGIFHIKDGELIFV